MTQSGLKCVLVTGGVGFIGSAVVRRLCETTSARVVTLDRLTYAASPEALGQWRTDPRHRLVQADICDGEVLRSLLREEQPDAVLHLAAETHVDRSIDSPRAFLDTNVVGTQVVLEEVTQYWRRLESAEGGRFRLIHVSTDEVFGSLDEGVPPVTADAPYRPKSPYAATKASADHLVRAWYHTYGLPTIVTNCGNNFGPWQFPEKLIPVVTVRALAGEPVPIYGSGRQIRDWIHVDDHAAGILAALTQGRPGATYLLGARNEQPNMEVAVLVCEILDTLRPRPGSPPRRVLMTSVADRPGHDLRYAIDPGLAENELGWSAPRDFVSALRDTVAWYLDHQEWVRDKLERVGGYRRIGLGVTL